MNDKTNNDVYLLARTLASRIAFQWSTFRFLFVDHRNVYRMLMNSAPIVASDMNGCLLDSVVLNLCALTERKHHRHSNCTVKVFCGEKEEMKASLRKLDAAVKPLRCSRNREIAHYDLDALENLLPKDGPSDVTIPVGKDNAYIEEVDVALGQLFCVLNEYEKLSGNTVVDYKAARIVEDWQQPKNFVTFYRAGLAFYKLIKDGLLDQETAQTASSEIVEFYETGKFPPGHPGTKSE